MKTASNLSLSRLAATTAASALIIAFGVMPLVCSPARAADVAAPALGIVASDYASNDTAQAPSPPAAPAEDMRKNISAMEDKVSENAKNVVKRLDGGSDTTTYADLNSARQTVTRIEAMIDVEKHLAELEKLRGERGNGARMPSSAAALSNAIPASALTPPPQQVHLVSERQASEPVIIRGHIEISRISGTDGRYTAVLKLPSGEVKTVRLGDQLQDGESISSISASSVGIIGKGTSYTLHIKNVDVIYSAMR